MSVLVGVGTDVLGRLGKRDEKSVDWQKPKRLEEREERGWCGRVARYILVLVVVCRGGGVDSSSRLWPRYYSFLPAQAGKRNRRQGWPKCKDQGQDRAGQLGHLRHASRVWLAKTRCSNKKSRC